jgi:hypothetical protein
MIRKQLLGIACIFASSAGTMACGLATDGEAAEASSSSPIIPTNASVQRIYFNTTNHLAIGGGAAAAEIDLIAGADVAIETTSQDSSPLVFEILRIRNDGTSELVSPVDAESGFHLDALVASSDDAYAIYFPNSGAKAQSIEIRLTCNSPAGECTRAGQPGDHCTEVFVCDEGLACSAAAAGPTNAYLAGGVCLTPNGQIVE